MTVKNVYGYVNGKPVYSRDEFIYNKRGFGAITSDDFLIKYAQKVTYNWSEAGWHQSFRTYYLSDYALSEPYQSLTIREFDRLRELQKMAQDEYRRQEEARRWNKVQTMCWADNSVEELWRDKDGIEKIVVVVAPHGDLC